MVERKVLRRFYGNAPVFIGVGIDGTKHWIEFDPDVVENGAWVSVRKPRNGGEDRDIIYGSDVLIGLEEAFLPRYFPEDVGEGGFRLATEEDLVLADIG